MPSPQSYETFEINIEEATAAVMKAAQSGPKGKVAIDPETVEQDLARLVLALIEFLRQLVELQAIRRMEAGRLSEEE